MVAVVRAVAVVPGVVAPVVGVAPVVVAVPAMGLAVAGAWAVPAMDLDGAVVRAGVLVAVAVDGAITTVVHSWGGGYGGCWRYDAWGRWRNFCYPPYPY